MDNNEINFSDTKNHVFGITGALGVGKSSLAQELKRNWSNGYIHIIELDDVRRYILWESVEEEHIYLRQQLAQAFNLEFTGEEAWLNRPHFTRILFSSKKWLHIYSQLATPVLKKHIEYQIKQHTFSIIVWAYLIEEEYTSFVNKTILLVNTPPHMVLKRFYNFFVKNPAESKDSYNDVSQRMSLEPTYDSRVQFLKEQNFDFIEYDNNDSFDEDCICVLVNQLSSVINENL